MPRLVTGEEREPQEGSLLCHSSVDVVSRPVCPVLFLPLLCFPPNGQSKLSGRLSSTEKDLAGKGERLGVVWWGSLLPEGLCM